MKKDVKQTNVLPGPDVAAVAPPQMQAGTKQSKRDEGKPFPDDFQWGALTTAYQAEGAASEGGRGPSIWDAYCQREEVIFEGQSGEVSCDHYHRFREDIGLMRTIGLKTLRFSISWPRALPEGTGCLNPAGMDFYDRYIDALLAAGIQPAVTLFHWDYPEALYCRGGWLNPASPSWFAEYAQRMAVRFGDRVKCWMTHNEPVGPVFVGHYAGGHAPGIRLSWKDTLLVGHRVLLSHGLAVQAMRQSASGLSIGMALCGVNGMPATTADEDIAAARQGSFAITGKDLMPVSWWADPAILGAYPEDGVRLFEKDMPPQFEDDMATICQPLDFFGMNIYHGTLMRMGKDGRPETVFHPQGIGRMSVEWPVTPEVMYWTPKFLHERYRLPLIITENGMSNLDWVSRDGKVHDPQRIDYLARYLIELERAMREGTPVLGYWVWGILDNFEWNAGYKVRFGLVHVDYATQKRTLKDSAHWYSRLIATRGASLEEHT